MTVAVGTQFDHYEIIAPLGAGGMGEVYRARDTHLDRAVAIKVLPAEFAQDADRLRRFEQEAKATSALNHPNILTVHDFGIHEGNLSRDGIAGRRRTACTVGRRRAACTQGD